MYARTWSLGHWYEPRADADDAAAHATMTASGATLSRKPAKRPLRSCISVRPQRRLPTDLFHLRSGGGRPATPKTASREMAPPFGTRCGFRRGELKVPVESSGKLW